MRNPVVKRPHALIQDVLLIKNSEEYDLQRIQFGYNGIFTNWFFKRIPPERIFYCDKLEHVKSSHPELSRRNRLLCFVEKLFWKFSETSHKNNASESFFLVDLLVDCSEQLSNTKVTPTPVFSSNIFKSFQNCLIS